MSDSKPVSSPSAEPPPTVRDPALELPVPVGWPQASPNSVFSERRARLLERLGQPALLAAGLPRARNFPANIYPFRADSHFLYFVGTALPGALLRLDASGAVLFAPEPSAEDRLWHGPQPGISELEQQLGLPVRPLAALSPEPFALLAHQCPRTRAQLAELRGRPAPEPGEALRGEDADFARAVVDCRLVHDAAALAQIAHAASVTSAAHVAAMRATRPGQREAVPRAVAEATVTAVGMGLAYNPIVTVSGQVLHGHESRQLMRSGQLLLMDLGAETPEGWAADVTRTWPVSGRFSQSQRAIYEVVLAALAAALSSAIPGQPFARVHHASHRALTEGLAALGVLRGSIDGLLEREASAVFYPHGVGHLLGLDVHDLEDLGDLAGYPPGQRRAATRVGRYLRLARRLEVGMVVTLEPGFYQVPDLLEWARGDRQLSDAIDWVRLEHFADVQGIRLEDDVQVGPHGAQSLSDAPLQPADVEACCAG